MQSVMAKQNVNLESIKAVISSKIDSAGWTSWIAPLQFNLSGDCLDLVAHNQFAADYVQSVYGNTLRNIAADFCLGLNISVASRQTVKTANDNVVASFAPSMDTNIKSDCFDKFVASDENAFAVAACKKIASGNANFAILFIYGASGCGKSMLTDCIYNESEKTTIKMSGGQFVSDFARALRDKTIFAFKDCCRNCDTFILDDVCALAGKRATMDEFMQLVIDLRNSGKNVVITANAAPNALNGFDRRMQSLFASGLVVDLVAPNVNVRRSILRNAGVDKDVCEELSKRLANDGHLIEGVINKINTYTELMGERVDMNIASRLLGDVMERAKTPISMVKSMCEKMCVSYEEICGNSRTRRLVRARQIMMCALKNATHLSLTEIGNVCGGRDHATVVYALNQIESQKSNDLVLGAEIDAMINLCK